MANREADADSGWADLEALMESHMESMTPAERSISAYFRENRKAIPYETGARLADAVGVSEMTVIRFVRRLGYGNLRELKDGLRPRPTADSEALDDVRDRFTSRTQDLGQLTKSLQLELDAVQRAYQAATSPPWPGIVSLVADRPHVHVTGFQATQGVALDFASRLKYVRPGVRFAEARAGIYSDVLESDPDEAVLVQVDTASYARKGVLLARKAKEFGIPLVIVTDRFSHWAREYTEYVLEQNTHVGMFWDSTASLAVVLNLLIHSVAARLGESAEIRFKKMVALGEHFSEFDAAASRSVEKARSKTRK